MSYLKLFHSQITGPVAGHKLVFLHGVMGAGINWRRIAQAFEDEFQVLTFDQRGHGRSHHPDSGYHPRDYAQDLKMILDELGWSKIFLVGHSMGGRNALEFAVHYPQRVQGLVIEDIGPESSSKAIDRIERLLSLVPTPFTSREAVREFFKSYPSLIPWYPQPEAVSRFLESNIEMKPNGQWDWRFARQAIFASMKEGRNEDRWDAFGNLKMPVLVVRGERSTDLSRETYEKMKQVLPSASYEEIPNAGHWVHFDQPELFIARLKAFFLTCLQGSVY